jgi:hypothetical protein
MVYEIEEEFKEEQGNILVWINYHRGIKREQAKDC